MKEFEKMFQTGKGGKTSDKDAFPDIGDLIQSLGCGIFYLNIAGPMQTMLFSILLFHLYECRIQQNQLLFEKPKKPQKRLGFCRK